MFSAAFWAVPAPSRVDPAIISGPVARQMGTSAKSSKGVSTLLAIPITFDPAAFTAVAIARAKGVVPLALRIINTSFGVAAAATARALSMSSSTSPGHRRADRNTARHVNADLLFPNTKCARQFAAISKSKKA